MGHQRSRDLAERVQLPPAGVDREIRTGQRTVQSNILKIVDDRGPRQQGQGLVQPGAFNNRRPYYCVLHEAPGRNPRRRSTWLAG